ncbi:hypothetical protein [Variovorax boronicumulans]|uniref:hypothetical protein n=1 Tax=Variovorax boronicumulans TaxID=436515 RepID=UPI0012E5D97C|nr:hypothetical protein [Variovorax boronicumulans]GER20687.1 hypothetical protein VCH24_57280 [Variovorax boronicumulans]
MAHLIRRFSVLFGLSCFAAIAHAEPVTIISGLLYAVGGYGAVAAVVLSIASSAYNSSQAKKKARQAAARKFAEDVANLRDRTATLVSSEAPWTTVYGAPARVGGSIVAVLDSGAMAHFKHIVIVFAAHECEAIDEIFIDGTSVGRPNAAGWTDGAEFQMPPLFNGWPSEGPSVNVQFHTSPGGVDTADGFLRASLHETFPDVDFWTEQHKLSGCTYAVVTLNLLFDRFQGGIPEITARIRGKKVHDPRTGQTVYSRNPALCLADFLRSESGYLAAADQIDENALIAAANACDEQVYTAVQAGDALNYGNSRARYVCDGMFRSDQDRESTRQQIEDAMAGFSLESGGVWRVQAGAWSTPVLNLDDDDMLAPTAVAQTAHPGASRFNGMRGTYVNGARNGVSEDFSPYQNSNFRALDAKDKFTDMALAFTASHMRCHQIARVVVEQSRGGFVLRIHPKMLAWHLQPGDRIVLSSALYGFTNKTFRVTDWTYARNAPLSLLVIEDVPAYYDLADEVLADAAPNTNLPSPFLQPQAPFDFKVESGPSQMSLQDGGMVARARVSWAKSNELNILKSGAVEVQWRSLAPVSDWHSSQLPGDATETFLLGLSVRSLYQVRARFRTPYASSPWATAEHTLVGKGGVPGDVAGLALDVTDAGIVATWGQPIGLDLLDWSTTRVRIGASWELADEVFSAKGVAANLGWLRAGTQRVWASHGSTSNQWSVPVSASIDIAAPAQPIVNGTVWRNEIDLAWQDCKTMQPIAYYELRRGATLETSEEIGRTAERTFVRTEATGSWRYWVRAVDAGGNGSAAAYVQLTVLPGIDEALEELEKGLNEAVDELKAVDQAQGQALTKETQDRAQALSAEAAARTAALAAETAARSAALVSEAQQRTQQVSQVTNALTAEATTRSAADQAEITARVAAVSQEVADRKAAVTAEASTRATAITAEQSARAAALLAETNARSAAIADEATARQTADESLSSRITTLNASLSTAQAALQTEATTRASADAAEASARQQLATQLQAADASLTAAIGNEASARSAADAAEARSRESLTVALVGATDLAATLAYVNGASLDIGFAEQSYGVWQAPALGQVGSGLIAEERQARVAADAAEVSARETLQAQLTGGYGGSDLSQVVSGLIYQERSARATSDEALAQQITLISAGVGEQFDYAKIWYFDSGLEAWTGNGTPSVAAGWIRPANHATDPFVVSPVGIAANGSTYGQIRMRVRKVGAPAWDGALSWRAASDSGFDASRRVTMTEPTYDGAGIGMVTVSPGWDVAIDQLRIELSAAQTATAYFEIDWVAIGRPSPGASNAALQSEIAARASADAAEVSARENLATQLRGAYNGNDIGALSSGLLASERDARVSADSAEVTARQQLAATVASNKTNADAALVAEQTARANADAAEVTARQALAATVAGNLATVNAAINAEQSARATADTAEVTARESLATQVRGAYTGTDVGAVSSGLVYSERQARIAADNAEITARTALAATVAGNKTSADAALVTEQSVRATADTANANAITALQATVTGNATAGSAALQAEAVARAQADSAEAIQRQGLSVALTGVPDTSGSLDTVIGASLVNDFVGNAFEVWEKPTGPTLASGLIYEERQARITADAAEVSARQALEAVVNTNKADAAAAVTAEQSARVTADTANTNAITALSATVNHTTNGLPSKASNTALTALTTRVTNAEGLITSQGDAITSINSGLELGRADSQASLTADESLANATAWRSHYGTNLSTFFVTTTTGKVATTVCRSPVGGANFWNYSKSKVVIDPVRTYRLTAWVRRVDANGTHYWTWWRNTLGNYSNSPIAIGSLPNNVWTQISLDLLGSAFGDTSVSPGFALNHTGGTTGYTEIQGFRFEDVTDSLRITKAETTKADASAVNALTTRVTSAEGSITAQANAMTSLTATVNGHTSSISTNASAIATLDGTVKSQWRLNVNADKKVAGMILNNDGTKSELVVLVDKFAIAQDGPGGVPTFPFVVGSIGGTPSVGINGNMFVDGSIKARSLDVEQLTASISKLGYITSGQVTINGDITGTGWGYIRSPGKWRNSSWGWILAQHPTGDMFVDFTLGGCGLVMQYMPASSYTGFHLWGPGFNLDQSGLRIDQAEVINTLNIRGEAVTVPRFAVAPGSSSCRLLYRNNTGETLKVFVTGSVFMMMMGGVNIYANGNAIWVGAGVAGSTVTGGAQFDCVPGDTTFDIISTAPSGYSGSFIYAIATRR